MPAATASTGPTATASSNRNAVVEPASAAAAAAAVAIGPEDELDEPPEEPRANNRGSNARAGLMKPFVVLALPGMYLFYKYSQYRREQRELSRRRVTERELQHLHHKIDKLLTKLEENEPEMASSQEDECVICVNARATMQTAPCGHRVVCRRCFVKTIQMAVSQRLLPLRCVICRAKILRLKQTLIPRDYSMSGKSWVLPQSASEYNMATGVPVGVTGPGGRWTSGNVPASASLYSMSSGSSSISGVSSVSSATSSSVSSAGSSGSSSLGKPSKVRQPLGASFRKTQNQSMKMRVQDPVQQAPNDDDSRRLPPIKEFQRDYKLGKTSTRLRCAQKIVTQLETAAPTPPPPPPPTTSRAANKTTTGPSTSKSSSSIASTSSASTKPGSASSDATTSSSSNKSSTKRSSSSTRTTSLNLKTNTKPLTVAQEVQRTKKEKEREKEREKAEKARLKEAEKAEKARQKEAKKLAKEEKKRAKKEAKARRKEAEEALLRDVK